MSEAIRSQNRKEKRNKSRIQNQLIIHATTMIRSTLDQEGECTCGNQINKEGRGNQPKQHQHAKTNSPQYNSLPQENQNQMQLERLDSSFVYLPPPTSTKVTFLGSPLMAGMDTNEADGLYNHGFGRAHDHICTLLDAMEDCTGKWNGDGRDGNGSMECFCSDCVQRIAIALDENTDRLQLECQAYVDAVKDEKYKQTRLEKALSINLGVTGNVNPRTNEASGVADADADADDYQLSGNIKDDLVESTVRAFQQEMKVLATYCIEHHDELNRLNNLLLDQIQLSEALTVEEEAVISEFNALEIDARSFEDTHHRLTLQCHAADREVAALSCVKLHSALFDITVDEKGLRYPLINDLRFSHRPKRDLRWGEINAAWSQATQLVMFVASSTKFSSRGFRIVLLTTCAKIIEVRSTAGGNGRDKEIVHHLGVEMIDSSAGNATMNVPRKGGVDNIIVSIRIFHALLREMFEYLRSMDDPPPSDAILEKLPFDIGPSFIGSHDLRQIHETDDVGWSAVIHCIASNMRWLSRNVSHFAN